MKPKSQDNPLDSIPRPSEILAFDPDEFVTAFTWAMNAASGRAQVDDPASSRLRLEEEDGGTTEIHFGSTAEVRVILAMKERYADHDMLKYYSSFFRILALIDLIKSGRLASWTHVLPGEPDRQAISDSVVEAAAVVPLSKQGHFPVREFLRKVREIDSQKKS